MSTEFTVAGNRTTDLTVIYPPRPYNSTSGLSASTSLGLILNLYNTRQK